MSYCLQAVDQKQEKNYVAERMIVEVLKNHKPVMILFPERRNFPRIRNQERWWRSIRPCARIWYVVYAGVNQGSEVPTISCVPESAGEVGVVWRNCCVMGTIVALLHRGMRTGARRVEGAGSRPALR